MQYIGYNLILVTFTVNNMIPLKRYGVIQGLGGNPI